MKIGTIKFKDNPKPKESIIPNEVKVYIIKNKNYLQITDMEAKIVCIRPYNELIRHKLSEDELKKEAQKELLEEMLKDNDNNVTISTMSLRKYLNKKLSLL